MDVLGLSKTHLFGQGIAESGSGSECGVCEGMKSEVVWAGLGEGYEGRNKEECAILMPDRI